MKIEQLLDGKCRIAGQRQPTTGLMLHSDQGSQYASHEYQTLLKQYGMIYSMSRKGNCWDNTVMECFFLNLKMERVWQRKYATQIEATKDMTDYIVEFYNCQRRHSASGNLAPIDYENQFAAKRPIEVSEIYLTTTGNYGKITVRTGTEYDMVWMEFSDTEKGIAPKNLKQIFDHFFTTKPVDKGTVLGLSLSFCIIEKHHGRIEVGSEAGRGTTFRVWMPVKQSR